ncbi:MAG: Crp/Fnr family transcriptional regulator [Alphaproteobacteria bacterium]
MTTGLKLSFQPGQVISPYGDTRHYIYDIKTGVVALRKCSRGKQNQIFHLGFPNSLIGFNKTFAFDTELRALNYVTLRAYLRLDVEKALSRSNDLCAIVLAATLREAERSTNHILRIANQRSQQKVARFILEIWQHESGQDETLLCFTMPLTRTDMANYLGLTFETTSRCFSELKKDNVIKLGRANKLETVYIQDLDRLNTIANSKG